MVVASSSRLAGESRPGCCTTIIAHSRVPLHTNPKASFRLLRRRCPAQRTRLSSGADTAAEQTSDLQLPQPRRPTAEHTIPWRARWRASTACAACLIHGSAGVCRGTYVTLQQAGRSDLTSGAATPAAVTISSTARRSLVVQPYVMLPSTARRGTALLLRL